METTLIDEQRSARAAQAPHARVRSLDGLRGMAILAVLLHHLFDVKLLWMGVDLFFVLSGFLITTILLRQKSRSFGQYIGHFYKRRVQRILPPYALTLLVSALIFGTFWLHAWYLYLGGMNFLMPLHLPNLYTLPLWSLAVEEQFYLLWPLAVYYLNRRQLVILSVVLIVLAPILRYVCTPLFFKPWAIYMLLPFRMDCLATGGLIALLWGGMHTRLDRSPRLRRSILLAAGTLSIVALAALVLLDRHHYTTYGNTAIGNSAIYECTLIIVTSVFYAALSGSLSSFFSWKPLVWLGTISYTLYLIHLTIIDRVYTLHLHNLSFLLAIPLILLYSSASWYGMEKPILRIGRGDAPSVTAKVASYRD